MTTAKGSTPAYGSCTHRTACPSPRSSTSSSDTLYGSAHTNTSAAETSDEATTAPPPAPIASAIQGRTPSGATATVGRASVMAREPSHGHDDAVPDEGQEPQ